MPFESILAKSSIFLDSPRSETGKLESIHSSIFGKWHAMLIVKTLGQFYSLARGNKFIVNEATWVRATSIFVPRTVANWNGLVCPMMFWLYCIAYGVGRIAHRSPDWSRT